MAKETSFEQPTRGHVGLLVYDSVNDDWYAVLGDAQGHLKVDVVASGLPTGAATAANQTTMITALQLIDDLRNALGSVDTDDLQVDVKTSALPTGAATAANQTTMITALQLIDDLRNALDSVGTDELDVNIEDSVTLTVQSTDSDKIFSFESIVEESLTDTNLGAGTNNIDGTAVGTGKVWKLTEITTYYTGTVPTEVRVAVIGLAGNITLLHQLSPVSNQRYFWNGEVYMEAGDYIRVIVNGATAGDALRCKYCGVQMDEP